MAHYLNGRVKAVAHTKEFQHPRTGEIYPARDEVQIEEQFVDDAGNTVFGFQAINTGRGEEYRKLIGQKVLVPVNVILPAEGSRKVRIYEDDKAPFHVIDLEARPAGGRMATAAKAAE